MVKDRETRKAVHQRLTMRAASIASASTSARHIKEVERSSRLAAGTAAARIRGDLRIRNAHARGLRKKKGPGMPGPFASYARNTRLLQRAVDRGELGVQVAAEAIDDRDDRQRNAGSNQAIFDRGGAGLVLHETGKQVLHNSNSMYTWLSNLSLVEPAFSAP